MKYSISLLAFLLCGCAPQLTSEARSVRVISPSVAQQCKHLGLAQAFQPPIAGGTPAAQIEIRNRVAAAGGNAYVPSAQGQGSVTADVYACQFI